MNPTIKSKIESIIEEILFKESFGKDDSYDLDELESYVHIYFMLSQIEMMEQSQWNKEIIVAKICLN